MTEETVHASATFVYDGRGFLATATQSPTDCGPSQNCGPVQTSATYGSGGVLYVRDRQPLFAATSPPLAQTRVFYFAGRPVAQLDGPPASGHLTFLTVDHLGTPILATGYISWIGGFEPFGRDYTNPSAQSLGIFLRLPGQWDDAAWDSLGGVQSGSYYNVHRWYEAGTGRYAQSDPLRQSLEAYLYGHARPTLFTDRLAGRGGSDDFARQAVP
jgi:RHS repeat-associated protein